MKQSRPIIFAFFLLLAVTIACGAGTGGDEPTSQPEVQPTEAPPTEAASSIDPTAPPPTEAPEELPTEAPATEPPPTEAPPTETPPTEAPPQAAFELAAAPFTHPQGIFELYPPEGWTAESEDGGATFNAPDDSGFINVEVTNTGLVLDGDSFERFVDARDLNIFGGFESYQVTSRKVDRDLAVARVTKRLLFDSIPQTVMTLYDQRDQTVFALDFWAEENVATSYLERYEEIIDTASVDAAVATSLVEPYFWIYTFYGPDDMFSIEVPIPWRYEVAEGDVAIVDTFYSPDEHGIVQNIAYDDGDEVSRSEAGAFALELLKDYYAEDIRISDDQVQADGSERLTWTSPSGDFSGISFLETRGTTFLLFSVLWDNPFEDAYYDALDYTISTYEVPE